jgi:hypothetical protein
MNLFHDLSLRPELKIGSKTSTSLTGRINATATIQTNLENKNEM